MKKSFNIKYLFLVFSLLAAIAGCKKPNVSTIDGTERLFRPGSVSVSAGQTSAKVTWTNLIQTTGEKYSYTAQFSRDTTFAKVDFTIKSDSTGVTATNDSLKVRTSYWVRVKTNKTATRPESAWAESSHFQITGEQYFLAVRELEIKETQVTLRFTNTPGLTKITMTPPTGSAFDVALTASDLSAGLKVITGLTPGSKYNAELFASAISKGYTTFTTLPLTVYTTILDPGADVGAAILAAADGAIIGLNPGIYAITSATTISGKTVTLKSTSGNPYDTKINFKGFVLLGTGSGLKVSGLDLDGTINSATYFCDMTSANSNATAAAFTTIVADNCYIHGIGTALVRGDRASVFSIGDITFKNCVIYDVTGSSAYCMFHLNKLLLNTLTISQCTMYNFNPALITCTTTMPTMPIITINACTINNFGYSATPVDILNASANPVNFTITKSIIANSPRTGAITSLITATAASTVLNITSTDTFNLLTTSGGTALTFPTTATVTSPQTVNLGWNSATTDFTLPAGSVLRTASPTAGAIGDPRWTY